MTITSIFNLNTAKLAGSIAVTLFTASAVTYGVNKLARYCFDKYNNHGIPVTRPRMRFSERQEYASMALGNLFGLAAGFAVASCTGLVTRVVTILRK